MRLDPKSHVPIYLQIVEGIKASVASGVIREGEVLPSVRALALDVHVNPNTVQRAYEELERQGITFARRGRGMFVAKMGKRNATEKAEQALRLEFVRILDRARDSSLKRDRVESLFQQAMTKAFRKAGKLE